MNNFLINEIPYFSIMIKNIWKTVHTLRKRTLSLIQLLALFGIFLQF